MQLDALRESIGRIEARQLADLRGPLRDHEFKVFSQSGEDGILQYLTRIVAPLDRSFVEIGVEDYREANTRFLLIKDQWSGLVVDGSAPNVARIFSDQVYWTRRLRVAEAFIDRDNVNGVLTAHGATGELGLLSVDIDGNDYWVFDAINCVAPAIAIVEYNYRFGPTAAVTIPYDPAYRRSQSSPSWLVTGASLQAIANAAARKDMAFVGCNSFGNNAFFVRRDLVPSWFELPTVQQGFVSGQFRESLVRDGVYVVPDEAETRALIDAADLVDAP